MKLVGSLALACFVHVVSGPLNPSLCSLDSCARMRENFTSAWNVRDCECCTNWCRSLIQWSMPGSGCLAPRRANPFTKGYLKLELTTLTSEYNISRERAESCCSKSEWQWRCRSTLGMQCATCDVHASKEASSTGTNMQLPAMMPVGFLLRFLN